MKLNMDFTMYMQPIFHHSTTLPLNIFIVFDSHLVSGIMYMSYHMEMYNLRMIYIEINMHTSKRISSTNRKLNSLVLWFCLWDIDSLPPSDSDFHSKNHTNSMYTHTHRYTHTDTFTHIYNITGCLMRWSARLAIQIIVCGHLNPWLKFIPINFASKSNESQMQFCKPFSISYVIYVYRLSTKFMDKIQQINQTTEIFHLNSEW